MYRKSTNKITVHLQIGYGFEYYFVLFPFHNKKKKKEKKNPEKNPPKKKDGYETLKLRTRTACVL